MDKFAIIFEPQNLQLYWIGFLATLELLAVSLVGGALLTLPLTLMRVSKNAWLSKPVWLFTYVIRGTPLLIQVYFIYYGIAQLEWVQGLWDTTWPFTWFKDLFFCAVLAFTLNTCAYTIEMLGGAIRETPAGEIEAVLIQLPMRGLADSLNVSATAAVLAYESVRQEACRNNG